MNLCPLAKPCGQGMWPSHVAKPSGQAKWPSQVAKPSGQAKWPSHVTSQTQYSSCHVNSSSYGCIFSFTFWLLFSEVSYSDECRTKKYFQCMLMNVSACLYGRNAMLASPFSTMSAIWICVFQNQLKNMTYCLLLRLDRLIMYVELYMNDT